jgi:biotin operon repressor
MLYQRSLEIERRLEEALELIRSGDYSTPMLAEKLGVSIPTVSRHVTALRERGHKIRSERTEEGWRFVLDGKSANKRSQGRTVLTEGRIQP